RHLDLVAPGDVLTGGVVSRWDRSEEPGVAAEAPVPAQSVNLTNDGAVLGTDVGRVGPDQGVTVPSATNELVPALAPGPARPPGRWSHRRFHGPRSCQFCRPGGCMGKVRASVPLSFPGSPKQ